MTGSVRFTLLVPYLGPMAMASGLKLVPNYPPLPTLPTPIGFPNFPYTKEHSSKDKTQV